MYFDYKYNFKQSQLYNQLIQLLIRIFLSLVRNQELNGQTQHVQSQLPATLRREHCILQWTWHCNNMYAENPAQVWRQCADIKIE